MIWIVVNLNFKLCLPLNCSERFKFTFCFYVIDPFLIITWIRRVWFVILCMTVEYCSIIKYFHQHKSKKNSLINWHIGKHKHCFLYMHIFFSFSFHPLLAYWYSCHETKFAISTWVEKFCSQVSLQPRYGLSLVFYLRMLMLKARSYILGISCY